MLMMIRQMFFTLTEITLKWFSISKYLFRGNFSNFSCACNLHVVSTHRSIRGSWDIHYQRTTNRPEEIKVPEFPTLLCVYSQHRQPCLCYCQGCVCTEGIQSKCLLSMKLCWDSICLFNSSIRKGITITVLSQEKRSIWDKPTKVIMK